MKGNISKNWKIIEIKYFPGPFMGKNPTNKQLLKYNILTFVKTHNI